MSKQPLVISMDLETNGSTVPSAAPIQIGIYGILPDGSDIAYESMIYWPEVLESDWSAEAEAIHGISFENFATHGSYVRVVTDEIGRLFTRKGVSKPWVVGFNVAGFDLTTLRDWHQPLWNLFSHRSVDLNALCTYVGSLGIPRRDSPNPWNFVTLKKRVKQLAAQRLRDQGYVDNAHDAFYDAMLAWHVFDILKSTMKPYVGFLNQAQKGLFDE